MHPCGMQLLIYAWNSFFENQSSRLWTTDSAAGPSGRTQSWRRHQMETFSVILAICAGNSPVTGEFPAQRPVTRSFDIFFDLRMNIRLSKESWGWWFETPSRPLYRHRYIDDLTPSQLFSVVFLFLTWWGRLGLNDGKYFPIIWLYLIFR